VNRLAFKSLFFKGSAVISQFVSLYFVLTGFDVDLGAAWLVMLSATQLSIPFIGAGLTQYLVREVTGSIPPVKLWIRRYFLFFVVVVFCFGLFGGKLEASGYLLAIFCELVLVISLAEILRASSDIHRGFMYYNGLLLALSLTIYVSHGHVETVFLVSLLPFFIIVSVLAKMIRLRISDQIYLNISQNDYSAAINIAIVSQFYNLVVIIGAFIVAPSIILPIIVVYKLQVVLNWPSFFWHRFAHRAISEIGVKTFFKKHFEIYKLYLLLLLPVFIGFLLIHYYDFSVIPQSYIDFLQLAGLYSILRLAINLVPPFEVFNIYRDTVFGLRSLANVIFLLVLVLSLIFLIFDSAVSIIISIEVLFFVWRIVNGRRVFKAFNNKLP
jgi:hypothetical protein